MLAALKGARARLRQFPDGLRPPPYEIDGVVEVPVQWLTDDAIYFRFFGGGADKWPPVAPGQVLESWLSEWREVHAEGGLFMITVHPWISGRGQRIALLRTLLAEIAASGEVWFATAEEIARHHARSANAGRFAVASDLPAPVGPPVGAAAEGGGDEGNRLGGAQARRARRPRAGRQPERPGHGRRCRRAGPWRQRGRLPP